MDGVELGPQFGSSGWTCRENHGSSQRSRQGFEYLTDQSQRPSIEKGVIWECGGDGGGSRSVLERS